MSDISRIMETARAAGVQVNPPRNTVIPYVSPETAAVGEVLSCTMGEWNGEPTSYAYAWFLDGAELGAVGATYTPVAGNEGHSVTCVVSATNTAGSATAPPSNAVTVTAVTARTTGHPPAHDAHSDARAEPLRRK
jgi:hypothetical protein